MLLFILFFLKVQEKILFEETKEIIQKRNQVFVYLELTQVYAIGCYKLIKL